MLRARRRTEDGQVVPLVALLMVFVIVPLWALLIDSTAEEAAQNRASVAAFMAADSASQVMDLVAPGPFTGSAQARLGQEALSECSTTGLGEDPGATVSCCLTPVRGQAPTQGASCTTPARYLHVVVSRDVQLPVAFFGWPVVHVSGSADGQAAVGTVTPY